VPDELQLVSGHLPLADEHLVERGAYRQHVIGKRKPFARSGIKCDQQHGARTQRGSDRFVAQLAGEPLARHALHLHRDHLFDRLDGADTDVGCGVRDVGRL
jgi:hypothetical protein